MEDEREGGRKGRRDGREERCMYNSAIHGVKNKPKGRKGIGKGGGMYQL